jgi:NAD(P)-dependent dehydrogenase (short-subunit alcohol dehydrogenase family)
MGGGDLEGSEFADNILATLPLHRFGKAEEQAKAMLYLAGDDASFCTGTVLVSDGGEIIS